MLDVLAGRNDGGEVKGEIYLNDVARTNSMIRSCSAYVRQDDRLLAHLTVKETLMFVAQLKLPTTMSERQVEQRVRPLFINHSLGRLLSVLQKPQYSGRC